MSEFAVFFLLTQNNPKTTIQTVADAQLDEGFTVQPKFLDDTIEAKDSQIQVCFGNLGAKNGYENYISTSPAFVFDVVTYHDLFEENEFFYGFSLYLTKKIFFNIKI